MSLRPYGNKYIEQTKNNFLNAIGRKDLQKIAQENPWDAIQGIYQTITPNINIPNTNVDTTNYADVMEKLLQKLKLLIETYGNKMGGISSDLITNNHIPKFRGSFLFSYKNKNVLKYNESRIFYNENIYNPLWNIGLQNMNKDVSLSKAIADITEIMYGIQQVFHRVESQIEQFRLGREKYSQTLDEVGNTLSKLLSDIKNSTPSLTFDPNIFGNSFTNLINNIRSGSVPIIDAVSNFTAAVGTVDSGYINSVILELQSAGSSSGTDLTNVIEQVQQLTVNMYKILEQMVKA